MRKTRLEWCLEKKERLKTIPPNIIAKGPAIKGKTNKLTMPRTRW